MRSEFRNQLDEIYGNAIESDVLADAALALDIAVQFRALRQRRGLTQRAVAELTGRSQQAISKIENPTHEGHSLSFLKKVIEPLQAVLDVTIVPNEDLESYQSLFPAKPVLEDMESRQRSIMGNTPLPVFTSPPISAPSPKRFQWPSEGNATQTNAASHGRVISISEWLENRETKQVKHG